MVFFSICLFFFNKLHLFDSKIMRFTLIIIDFNTYSNTTIRITEYIRQGSYYIVSHLK